MEVLRSYCTWAAGYPGGVAALAGAAAGDGGDGDGRRGVEWRAAAAADGIERAGEPERYVLKSIHKH